MDKMLQEFLEFAKEKYGVNVTVSESDSPDSISSVFGASFLQTDFPVILSDLCNDKKLEYIFDDVYYMGEFSTEFDKCNITAELELAA